jgi:recyclin-1
VPDLFRFARTSKRMQEMVYDDTRWVQRLRCMGCWNEGEARARFEEVMRKKWEAQKARHDEEAKRVGVGVNGSGGLGKTSTTLFDAGIEEERQRRSTDAAARVGKPNIVDGFEVLKLSASPISRPTVAPISSFQDPAAILTVLSKVRSVRGSARHEYGRVYAALAPFYFDLARSRSHTDPVIFRVYREPEQQAKMLALLLVFAQSDWAQGWRQREEKLNTMIGTFENAVLREFEQGYEVWDIDGKMHRYAHVMSILNGGQAGIEIFVQKHPLFSDRAQLGNSMDCINQASSGSISLEPSREFFARLSRNVNEQAGIIGRVFPSSVDVLPLFLEKVGEDIIQEYVTPLFDEAHERSIPSYLKAISGIFEQMMQFAGSLTPIKGCDAHFRDKVDEIMAKIFEPHVDLYLQEELDYFKREAERHVSSWEKKLSEEDASTESFFMANVSRQEDKKDFLSSFKKVVMMPVNVLPSLPISSPFATSKPSAPQVTVNDANSLAPNLSLTPASSRPQTPSLGPNGNRSSSPANAEAPTDELAAKAAIMASRLAGIKSLFSIEVALNLVHSAKSSLDRAAHFVSLGGQTGGEAREQCEMIFVVLLQILGSRHVKSGFDKAVDHLSQYNPREVSEHNQQGVAPLVMFLELVNVGDLISQMIDVFYEQQLAATKLVDKNDFLDPAVKAKKKFEQMLDERVAAGLNKGIDVLMDEVEYVCATAQLPTDYNPPPIAAGKPQEFDIGPTKCAEQVIDIVSSHTKMLTGSTDKNMLDVFNQEVGLRLFTALCKHLKRQRISVDGSIKLISDMNLYFAYIQKLRNQDLLQYFKALRELSQIYLIDPSHAKEMATIIADGDRFYGIFRAEEVYEFAERRADWFQVKRNVERAMYGIGCHVM